MIMVTYNLKVVVTLETMVAPEGNNRAFARGSSVAVVNNVNKDKQMRMEKIGWHSPRSKRRRGSNNSGTKPDVTTTNLDFKLDYRKWQNQI